MYFKSVKISMLSIVSVMVLSTLAASSSHAGDFPPDKGGKNKIMIYSHPVYTGEATMELDLAVDKVSDYMADHTNVFARGHYTLDSSQFSVSIAKPNDVAVKGLRDLIAKLDPENKLFLFENVERSVDELEEIQMSIVREFMIDDPNGTDHGVLVRKGTSIQSVGMIDSPSRVVVDVLTDLSGSPLEDNAEVQAINAKYPDSVLFSEESAEVTPTTSYDDVAPHYAGAGYNWFDNNGNVVPNSGCSLGFASIVDGVTYGLSAGHCRWGSQSNRLYAYSPGVNLATLDFPHYIGGLHTTTYKGSQSLYGDFSLLQGSTYAPFVYSSGPTSNSATPVVDATYTSPNVGAGLCSSGVTTGQICRYKIDTMDTCTNVGGELSCHEMKMISDQDLNGVKDCLGFAPGDSGGAVYNAVPGGVRGVGIISAESGGCPKWYYATSFYGIRIWNSSFHLLLY